MICRLRRCRGVARVSQFASRALALPAHTVLGRPVASARATVGVRSDVWTTMLPLRRSRRPRPGASIVSGPPSAAEVAPTKDMSDQLDRNSAFPLSLSSPTPEHRGPRSFGHHGIRQPSAPVVKPAYSPRLACRTVRHAGLRARLVHLRPGGRHEREHGEPLDGGLSPVSCCSAGRPRRWAFVCRDGHLRLRMETMSK